MKKQRRIYGYRSASFPATRILPQWTHEKVATVAWMVVVHGLNDMDFPCTRLTWLKLLPSV